MLKIGIIGFGKLGKSIAQQATERGHIIHQTYTSSDLSRLDASILSENDVIVECSNPDAAVSNLKLCAASQTPTISGTTGWTEHYQAVCAEFQPNGAFLYASNFSIGMNITFAVNVYLARLMAKQSYQVHIEETHHIHKLDKPSGTAITLAQGIIQESSHEGWQLSESVIDNDMVNIIAHREAEVPGSHSVTYSSSNDSITLIHDAFNREGFGLGAVLACEFIHGKQGIFTMQDVLEV